MENISKKMAVGAAWMVAFKLLERGIGLVSTIILARLLEPDDFGLVAMATAFLGLLLLLTNFNFDVVLIQKQNAERYLYDTAWTFNVLFGLALAMVLAVTAIPLAKFYNEPRLEEILYVLALSSSFGGFGNIGPVAFRKDLQFHKEFYFLLAKKLIAFVVCIGLAVTLRNYWALVGGTFAGNILSVLLSYKVHPYRPRFSLRGSRELFSFSLWLFVNNAIYFTYLRVADFIISKVLGNHALGVYTIAYEISNLPTTELVAPINRAVLPGYSRMAGNASDIRWGFLNVLSMIALCAIPAGVGIALLADLVVTVVLGEKWIDAIPLMQALAISGVFAALQTNTGSLFMAVGKPRYLTITSSIHLIVLFLPLLVFLLERHGLIGIAEAYLYSNAIILPVNFAIAMKLVKLRFLQIISVLWRPLIACGLMTVAVLYAREYENMNWIKLDAIRLFILVAIGAAAYSLAIFSLWLMSRRPEGAESFLLKKCGLKYLVAK